jgi:hypothetical protein
VTVLAGEGDEIFEADCETERQIARRKDRLKRLLSASGVRPCLTELLRELCDRT